MKLIDAKGDVNRKHTNGGTPVMSACVEDRLTCLQLLLDGKADLNGQSHADPHFHRRVPHHHHACSQ
jgi:ankyrin repeat protein